MLKFIMAQRFFLIDAFADAPFSGNPAGVVVAESEPDSDWMQSVAAEINQAETAFVWPLAEGFGLRWFTPTTEVDLCGHATLAASEALRHEGRGDAFNFETASGLLTSTRVDNDWVMDFPSEPPEALYSSNPVRHTLTEMFHGRARWIGANRMDWFVEIPSEVSQFKPDLSAIGALGLRGLIVTSSHVESDADFESRFFAPQAGVAEDPVTGSAHCALAPYWADRLGKTALVGYQASERGGRVRVEVRGERVGLCGHARIVVSGTLRV